MQSSHIFRKDWQKIKEDITKAQKTTKQTLFVSKYGVKEFNTVVSIETRTKKKRFKSRLVSKT